MTQLSDFIGKIKSKQASIAEVLCNGSIESFDLYNRLVGQHQGLSEALRIVDQLLEEENSDRDL